MADQPAMVLWPSLEVPRSPGYKGRMEVDGRFLDRLAEACAAGRSQLAPEVVLVGSNRLGRDLGRRLLQRTGGWANVRFLTFIDLGRELAREDPALMDLPLLSGLGKSALTREALRGAIAEDPAHPFLEMAGRPGFPPSLAALFDDLLDGGVENLPPPERVGMDRRRWEPLDGLYRRWRGLLARQVIHPSEILARGSAGAATFPERFGAARLWMAGFYDLTPRQEILIRALGASGVKILVSMPYPQGPAGRFAIRVRSTMESIGATSIGPDTSGIAQNALGRLQASLFDVPPPAGSGIDPSLAVVSCPDEEREVRETARMLLHHFFDAKIPFDRMAVAFPGGSREIYAPLIAEIFAGACIPHDPRGLGSLQGEPEGRALRALLHLLGDPAPPRPRLLDFLGFGTFLLPVPPGRLELLSRHGGIAAWSGDWSQRLRDAARRLSRPDMDDAEPGAAAADLEPAIGLLEELLRLLDAFPATGTWTGLLAALDGLAARAFPILLTHPELQRIRESLEGLGVLEEETDLESFRAAWEGELAASPGSGDGGVRAGVAAGSLMDLRGLRFEAVFILGVAERSFPAAPRTDPLLPDTDREAFNTVLPPPERLSLKGGRIEEEDLLFAELAAAAGRSLQLSHPRIDFSSGRARLPSVYLLQSAGILAGRRIGAAQIGAAQIGAAQIGAAQIGTAQIGTAQIGAAQIGAAQIDAGRIDGAPGVRRVGLTHGTHESADSLTAAELDHALAVRATERRLPRRRVLEMIAGHLPPVERICTLEERRWRSRLSDADGIVPAAILARLAGGRIMGTAGSISATRLEAYTACPQRYFLRHVLGLQEPEDPEEVFSIAPLDLGDLAHRILEETYRTLGREKLLPLSPDRLERAGGILDRILKIAGRRAEAELAVGLPLLWEMAQEGLRDGLHGILRADAGGNEPWTPLEFEAAFGSDAGIPVEIRFGAQGAGTAPLAVSLRGKIDRIDVGPGGAFRVIDYKTGKLPGKAFRDGGSLQLPVYLLAGKAFLQARGRAADLEASEAAYWSLREGAMGFEGKGWEGTLEKLRRVTCTVASGIEAGIFHPVPGPNRKNCEYCAFYEVCDPRVEAIASRKDDERLRPLEDLKESLDAAEDPAGGMDP